MTMLHLSLIGSKTDCLLFVPSVCCMSNDGIVLTTQLPVVFYRRLQYKLYSY